ncbi:MAG: hypothetical protein KatS3mg059_1265 [Thermomicrobiales bacterium]|nr:MAG: hypothetical protein KatS3mg059_1265 [Thermomicrobiales bacterium]
MCHAAQVVPFDSDHRANLGMSVHHRADASQVAEPLFANVSRQEDIDRWPHTKCLKHARHHENRGHTKAVIANTRAGNAAIAPRLGKGRGAGKDRIDVRGEKQCRFGAHTTDPADDIT